MKEYIIQERDSPTGALREVARVRAKSTGGALRQVLGAYDGHSDYLAFVVTPALIYCRPLYTMTREAEGHVMQVCIGEIRDEYERCLGFYRNPEESPELYNIDARDIEAVRKYWAAKAEGLGFALDRIKLKKRTND